MNPDNDNLSVAWSFAIEARTKLQRAGFEWILISSWENKWKRPG